MTPEAKAAAREIGELINRIMDLAPIAGVRVGIEIMPPLHDLLPDHAQSDMTKTLLAAGKGPA